jgi:hypothetical protein
MMTDGLVGDRGLDEEDCSITIDADDLEAHQLRTTTHDP